MNMRHEYSRKQLIEIRTTRAGVDHWVPAKVQSLTKGGAQVMKPGQNGREFHVLQKDMRPVTTELVQQEREDERRTQTLGAARRPTPKPFNPVVTPEALSALSKKLLEDKESQEADVLPLHILGEVTEEDVAAAIADDPPIVSTSYNKRDSTPTKISGFIKKRREEAKLSQKEFATLLDYSASQLCDVELGFRIPSDALLREFAKLMDLEIDWLLRLRDEPDVTAILPPLPTSTSAMEVTAIVAPAQASSATIATTIQVEEPMPVPAKTAPPANAPEALDVFFEFCDKVEEVCPRPRSAQGRVRWRELVKELYQLAKEDS